MKSVSFWAKAHPHTARLLIVLIHVVLSVWAVRLGILLLAQGLELGFGWMLFSLSLFGAGLLSYHALAAKGYGWQKAADGLLVLGTMLLLVHTGNRLPSTLQLVPAKTAAYEARLIVNQDGDITEKRGLKKILRKRVKEKLKKWKKATGGQVVFIIFTILLAVVLFFLLVALSCNLSCSGMEGLAVAVLLVGTAGLILLTIFAVKAILASRT